MRKLFLVLSLTLLFSSPLRAAPEPGLDSEIAAYLDAFSRYEAGDKAAEDEAKYVHAPAIARLLLSSKSAVAYRHALVKIDQLAASEPYAIADLGLVLQQEWERRFLLTSYAYNEVKLDRARLPLRLFLDMSALLLPGYVYANSARIAPEYFRLFRVAVSLGGAYTIFNVSFARAPLPAPAEIMTLGFPKDESPLAEIDTKAFYRGASAGLAGLTGETVMFGILQRVAMAGGGASVGLGAAASPETLGLSLVLGIGIDYSLTGLVSSLEDASAERALIKELREAIEAFPADIGRFPAPERLRRAKRLIMAALEYEAFYAAPLLHAIIDQQSNPKAAAKVKDAYSQERYGVEGPVAMTLARDVFLQSGLNPLKSEDAAVIHASLPKMTSDFRWASAQVVGSFARVARNLGIENQDAADQLSAFHDFLTRWQVAEDERAALRLRRSVDGYRSHVQVPALLFDVVALIRATGDEFITTYADRILMDRVRKYAKLAEAAEGVK